MFIFRGDCILTIKRKNTIYMRRIVQAKPKIQVIKSITNTRVQCIFVNKLTKTLPCLQYVKMKPLFQYLTIKTIDKQHFLIIKMISKHCTSLNMVNIDLFLIYKYAIKPNKKSRIHITKLPISSGYCSYHLFLPCF